MRWQRLPNLVSTAVLRRHLETMDRLDIEYDFLPRESEILPSALLGPRLPTAQREGRPVLRDRGQEQGMLGDDPSGGFEQGQRRQDR